MITYSTINPKEEDIVILKYDLCEVRPRELNDIYKKMKTIFPNNKLIMLPINCTLEVTDKERLSKIFHEYIEDEVYL